MYFCECFSVIVSIKCYLYVTVVSQFVLIVQICLSSDSSVVLSSWSVSQFRPAVPGTPVNVSPGVLSCPAHTTHTSAHTAGRSVLCLLVFWHKVWTVNFCFYHAALTIMFSYVRSPDHDSQPAAKLPECDGCAAASKPWFAQFTEGRNGRTDAKHHGPVCTDAIISGINTKTLSKNSRKKNPSPILITFK